MKTYILPVELRKRLKKPFGISILGNKKEVCEKFKQFLQRKKFKKIITVGDYCSSALPSDVKIFDGKIKRRKINPALCLKLSSKQNRQICKIFFLTPAKGGALRCLNPRGTIQKGCWKVIKRALRKNKNVFVEGEEDLLAIPAVLLAGKNTAVVYGLPNKGICLIEISAKTKKFFKEILNKFRTAPS